MTWHDTADKAGDSVLGTLLTFYDPKLVTIVQARGVGTNDFFRDRQRVVWRAILALHAEGTYVDVLTVETFLRSRKDDDGRGMLERAGGPGYLAVAAESSRPAALKDHAFLVAESGRWDRLRRACGSLSLAIDAQDDHALREAVALVKRDVVAPGEFPKLQVVKEGRAA